MCACISIWLYKYINIYIHGLLSMIMLDIVTIFIKFMQVICYENKCLAFCYNVPNATCYNVICIYINIY